MKVEARPNSPLRIPESGSHQRARRVEHGTPHLQPLGARALHEELPLERRDGGLVSFTPAPRQAVVHNTLAATGVEAGALPPALVRKLPRYPTLPATLLARLAVDERHQGRRLGEHLLVHALRRALTTSREGDSLAIIVDAIDERARAFYEHFEFLVFPDQPRRLFLPMVTIARLFGERA